MNKTILVLISFVSLIHADVPQYYAYVDSVNAEPYIFSQLSTIIGVLDQYENNIYRGVKVDFGHDGTYYSRYKGNNWWEYFFNRLDIGDTTGECRRIPNYEKTILSCSLYEFSVERAHELMQKYIEVKPEITAKVAAYQKEVFNDFFVIGIYYNKKDSSLYAMPEIPYKRIYDILLVHILQKSNLRIFVHTNDKRLYSFLKVKHPDLVFQYSQKVNFEINADEGEHELINCLLLSQTDLLIRTPSSFSLTASQFNPHLSVVELGEMTAKKTE